MLNFWVTFIHSIAPAAQRETGVGGSKYHFTHEKDEVPDGVRTYLEFPELLMYHRDRYAILQTLCVLLTTP